MCRDARASCIGHIGDASTVTANIFTQHYYGANMDDKPVTALPARHFTVQSLAAYWGVSPSHIYNLIHTNALRHMRIGKAIRIPTIFIKEYEEQSCQTNSISTASGNTTTELGTSFGRQKMKKRHQGGQSAYQRGLQIAAQRSSTALNSSRD